MFATGHYIKLMNTLTFKKHIAALPLSILAAFVCTLLVWWLVGHLQTGNGALAVVDPSIVQVILIAFLAWLVLLKITDWLAHRLLPKMLSQLEDLFEPTKKLTPWQQHVLYLALYALLALSGTGCLIAIC